MADDILRAIQEVARREFEKSVGNNSLICIVTNVDKAKQTCTVQNENDNEDVLYNVRLGATIEESDLVLYPKVGSYVLVSLLDRSNAYISKMSVIDMCELKTENGISLDAQKGKIEAKNDTSDLKSVLESIVSFLESATYTNSAGPTSVANNVASLANVRAKINQLLK